MRIAILSLLLAIFAVPALAQTSEMNRTDMKGMKSDAASAKSTAGTHHATGVVKTVDSTAGAITIAHESIKTLGWPAMTMSFKARDPTLLSRAKPGDYVQFTVVQSGNDYVVTSIR
jgi:Cu(I)/Ag(I) efflux system protein CusF